MLKIEKKTDDQDTKEIGLGNCISLDKNKWKDHKLCID